VRCLKMDQEERKGERRTGVAPLVPNVVNSRPL
jgi:hypothetical protein